MLTFVLPPIPPFSVPLCLLGNATSFCPINISSPQLVLVFPSVSQMAEEFSSPPCPRLSVPGTPLPLRVTPEIFIPWGNSSTLGVSVPLGKSTPIPLSGYPPGVFPHYGGLRPPPISLPLCRTRQPGFPADCQPSLFPLPFFTPHGAPPPLLCPCRRSLRPRWRLCRML